MNPKTTDKAKQFTRGGQITFHNIRMLLQINKTVWCMYLPALIFLIITTIYLITPKEIWLCAVYWCKAQINPILELLNFKLDNFVVPYHGKIYHIAPKNFLLHSIFVAKAKAVVTYIKIGTIIGSILSLGVFYAIVKWLITQGEKQTEDKFIRGAKLDTPENVAKLIRKQKQDSDITIDGMPIILNSETKHILVHGSTGSGKTQLISKLLDQIRKRGDRVFLYDKGGVYTATFYRSDQDKILNPFDSRCENWDLWQEASIASDFENIAESLIPMHGESDPFWVNAAQTIFASAAYTMQDATNRSMKELLRLLLTAELNDLHKYLEGTAAATLASDKIEKTAISIRSVITTYLKSLRFLINLEQSKKPKFSIKDWINADTSETNGWLFLSSNAEHHASIKPLLSMWFSMATITLLSLPENHNRRIWFICDELPSLHKLPQLPESIAEARKYGGCFVLGMQSYAQLEKVYGRNAGREIFDLMNTAFFFRSPSHDIAEFVSRALGTQEIEDMRENYSYGANTIRDGISIGSQRMINQIVSAAEIMELEEMKCYLRLAAAYPVTLLELMLNKRRKLVPGFIPSEFKLDEEIEELVDSSDMKVNKAHIAKKINEKKHGNQTGQKKNGEQSIHETKDLGKNQNRQKVLTTLDII